MTIAHGSFWLLYHLAQLVRHLFYFAHLRGAGHFIGLVLAAVLVVVTVRRFRRRHSYREGYLRSPGWRSRRRWLIHARGGRCEVCGKRGRLDVHHRHYDSLGHEQPGDVRILCRRHHDDAHAL